MTSASKSKARKAALKNGYRSGLEDRVSEELKAKGEKFTYEAKKIRWDDFKTRTYTPDFILENGIIVETKGRFMVPDRMKHLNIKKQYPHLDIRFVFTNPRDKINKGSKTTYGMWCDKHGFLYATSSIPDEWLTEGRKETKGLV